MPIVITIWICCLWSSLDNGSDFVWSWPCGVLVLGHPGGSLVQANISCCPCMALSSLSNACQGRVPSCLVGRAFWTQKLGLPQVLFLEYCSSQLLLLPLWNCVKAAFPGPSPYLLLSFLCGVCSQYFKSQHFNWSFKPIALQFSSKSSPWLV